MSNRKSGKRPKKRRRPGESRETTADKKPQKTTVDGRKHIGPIGTILIVIPFIAVVGFFAWFYLNSDDTKKTSKTNGKNKSNTQTKDDGSDSRPPWSRTDLAGKAWETDTDRARTWDQIDNPSKDGWDTEVFNNQVGKQLDKLKKLIVSDQPLDSGTLKKFTANDLQVQPLRPTQLETTFQDPSLHIQKASIDGAQVPTSSTIPADSGKGVSAFAEALQKMLAPYRDRQNLRLKIKVFRVNQSDGKFTTRQSVEIFGPTAAGLMEENAIWLAQWERDGDTPLLKDIKVLEYESVRRTGNTLFADCTESVLGKNPSFKNQILLEYDHYLDRIQFNRFLSILGNPGVAIGDVNGDGLEDIYVCQESGLPNLLFLQNADGTLRDHSKQSGADWLQNASAALIVDLNNDGINDLAVGISGGVVIAEGDGTGQFKIKTILDSSDHIMALTAADYDRDGMLDVYAAVYYPDGIDRETEDIVAPSGSSDIAYGDANDDGGPNSLFRNESKDGNWSFRDVTRQVGLDQNNQRLTLAASWEDYDNDGDQDLYVANDYGLNNLYRNDSQADGTVRFVDVANEANAEDSAFGMSVAWGDYDRDGWMDVYISNMFSYAGNRITFQEQFQTNATEKVRRGYQRFARGNSLLRNAGQPQSATKVSFQDQSLPEFVNRARWAWGSRFVDLNNDGWDDLVVANGYISTADTGDL